MSTDVYWLIAVLSFFAFLAVPSHRHTAFENFMGCALLATMWPISFFVVAWFGLRRLVSGQKVNVTMTETNMVLIVGCVLAIVYMLSLHVD
jgi:hypothetical protein